MSSNVESVEQSDAMKIVIDRHTFLDMAKMTKNQNLRMVYAKMMCRYYRKEKQKAAAGTAAV